MKYLKLWNSWTSLFEELNNSTYHKAALSLYRKGYDDRFDNIIKFLNKKIIDKYYDDDHILNCVMNGKKFKAYPKIEIDDHTMDRDEDEIYFDIFLSLIIVDDIDIPLDHDSMFYYGYFTIESGIDYVFLKRFKKLKDITIENLDVLKDFIIGVYDGYINIPHDFYSDRYIPEKEYLDDLASEYDIYNCSDIVVKAMEDSTVNYLRTIIDNG